MTIDQFNNTRFGCGMQVEYDGKIYDIESVDFQESLIAIQECPDQEDAALSWKRCENCRLIPKAGEATETSTTSTTSAEIEYKKQEGISTWFAFFNGKLIGKIVVEKNTLDQYVVEGDCKVYASDHTKTPERLIPGSPFETMNHAKAALEYHFRALLDLRTEYAA